MPSVKYKNGEDGKVATINVKDYFEGRNLILNLTKTCDNCFCELQEYQDGKLFRISLQHPTAGEGKSLFEKG